MQTGHLRRQCAIFGSEFARDCSSSVRVSEEGCVESPEIRGKQIGNFMPIYANAFSLLDSNRGYRGHIPQKLGVNCVCLPVVLGHPPRHGVVITHAWEGKRRMSEMSTYGRIKGCNANGYFK